MPDIYDVVIVGGGEKVIGLEESVSVAESCLKPQPRSGRYSIAQIHKCLATVLHTYLGQNP
jgi:hypothetical protein